MNKTMLIMVLALVTVMGAASAKNWDPCSFNDYCTEKWFYEQDFSDVFPQCPSEVPGTISGGGMSSYHMWYYLTGDGDDKYHYDTYNDYLDVRYAEEKAQVQSRISKLESEVAWLKGIVYQEFGYTISPTDYK